MRDLKVTNLFKVPESSTVLEKKEKLIYLFRSIIITLLSLLLAHVVICDLQNIATFVSNEKNDFQMSDIYNRIADYSPVSQASHDITIVAVDECSRQELLEVLEFVSEYNPKTIGLDVFLRNTSEDSLYVLSTLSNIPNLILPCKLEVDSEGNFHRVRYSYIEKHLDANYAYVNLNAASIKETVRDFTPHTLLRGDTILQFATAMAKIAAPLQYQELRQRKNQKEIINYSSVDIPILSVNNLYSSDDKYLSRYLTNKAILVGDTNNINDMYSTPTKEFVPGVLIHAYALNTILTTQYTSVTPEWINWLIAIVIGIIFIFVNMLIKNKWSRMGNLVMRLLQIILMFGMVFIGSYWYKEHLQYIDFSLVVLMIGFCALAVDVYDGIYAICIKIIQFVKNRKKGKLIN